MGLFSRLGNISKKSCSICGRETGLFDRKKLADGYACSECLKLTSPFWATSRKTTTVSQVKDHLAYREQNREALKGFHPDTEIGVGERCIHIDQQAGTFVLAAEDDENPDLFALSQVRDVAFDVYEHDVTSTDSDGDTIHEYYEYTFYLVVDLDHPHVRHARFKVNEHPVRNRGKRIKLRDAEAYFNGTKEIKGGLFSRTHKEDTERYMSWYEIVQEMVTGLREAAQLQG